MCSHQPSAEGGVPNGAYRQMDGQGPRRLSWKRLAEVINALKDCRYADSPEEKQEEQRSLVKEAEGLIRRLCVLYCTNVTIWSHFCLSLAVLSTGLQHSVWPMSTVTG